MTGPGQAVEDDPRESEATGVDPSGKPASREKCTGNGGAWGIEFRKMLKSTPQT